MDLISPTKSSPPSVFSTDGYQSSQTDCSPLTEKATFSYPDIFSSSRDPENSIKPTYFTPTFTTTTKSDLHFSAFPPQDLKRPASSILGWHSAVHVLHGQYKQEIFHNLIGNSCAIQRIARLPTESIPIQLINSEKGLGDEWEFYLIKALLTSPLAALKFTPACSWNMAVRKLPNSLEKLVFGPLGVTIRSVTTICERPAEAAESENAARQLLYITETLEVKCRTGLRWWVEKVLAKDIHEMHEAFRVKWDATALQTRNEMRRRDHVDSLFH